MNQSNHTKLFQSAVGYYQSQQFEHAENICQQLLQLNPKSHETMHLYALCVSNKSPAHAERLLSNAVSLAPQLPLYQKSYANLFLAQGLYQQALEHFLKLQNVLPNDPDVLYGIAFIHLQNKQYRSALNTIAQVNKTTCKTPKWAVLKARALLERGNTQQALDTLEQLPVKHSNTPNVVQNKALILRQLQQPNNALSQLKQMPAGPVKFYLAGCLHYDLQQYEQAIHALNQAIQMQPNYLDAHNALNKLHWERNNKELLLQSFKQSLIVMPHSIPLYVHYISHLILMNHLNQAMQVAQQALKQCGQHHPLMHALGTILVQKNQLDQALQLYNQALAQSPNNVRYLLDSANIYIKNSQYQKAEKLLQQANRIEPDNQEVWAYLGLCWRLTNNPKQHWLNNYPAFISVTKLPTPPGYTSFKQFWQELKNAIHALHTTEHQPLDQSVRNGTQTVGFLFHAPHPVIQVYRSLLTQHVQNYLNKLPKDQSHPLLRRMQPNFRFSGSWSVKLNKQGFHSNHVHPQGWLSICTYLQVPETIHQNDPTQQGWLKLGETSLGLGAREQTALNICPEEGLCVIFPSYTWHGTVPLQGDNARITIPCDIVPDI